METNHDLESLRNSISTLESELISLQNKDGPLSAAEIDRAASIDSILSLLQRLIQQLLGGGKPSPKPRPIGGTLIDGRYQGGNSHLNLDIRVDEESSGVISLDVYRTGVGGRSFVASVRTNPGERIALADGSWEVIGQDEHGNKASGRLALTVSKTDPVGLTGELFLNSALHSLPVRRTIGFSADWQSEQVRSIGLELESEDKVGPPPTYMHNGRAITLEAALQDAGLQVHEVGRPNVIPASDSGWGNTQLHTLLRDFAQAPLVQRAWEIHLLWLSKATRTGLLGIMFDTQDQLPRQGAAVFASTIRNIPGIDHDRKLIQTTVHELGHALNLAHRFERSVGRADSLSFMNYDWRYKSGNHRNEYWSKFNFTFDEDELEFLRHAPLPALIPGGAAFHSVNYWADGNGGYSPYVPEVPLQGYRLTLAPPLGGPVFAFGQPVFLEVELTNLTGRAIDMPPFVLDPKVGFLEVLIRRWQGESDSSDLANTSLFVPIYQRCFDMDPSVYEVIPDKGSIKDNLNLTFGSGGFDFAEPGIYDVTALLAFYDSQNRQEFIVRSNTLRIRVGVPKSDQEEQDAMVLLRSDVGLYFALGGSDGLEEAHTDLQEVRDRRQGRRKTIVDPIVANITRCQGINAGRPYTRFVDGKFKAEDGDRVLAAELLGMLDNRALQAFDASTAASTKRLATKHRKAAEK